jgi:hypothetical protein
MANNRIYLHCKECDEYLFLGKDYGTGFFYNDYDGKGLETELNEFYEKHAICGMGEPFDIRYDD